MLVREPRPARHPRLSGARRCPTQGRGNIQPGLKWDVMGWVGGEGAQAIPDTEKAELSGCDCWHIHFNVSLKPVSKALKKKYKKVMDM